MSFTIVFCEINYADIKSARTKMLDQFILFTGYESFKVGSMIFFWKTSPYGTLWIAGLNILYVCMLGSFKWTVENSKTALIMINGSISI